MSTGFTPITNSLRSAGMGANWVITEFFPLEAHRFYLCLTGLDWQDLNLKVGSQGVPASLASGG